MSENLKDYNDLRDMRRHRDRLDRVERELREDLDRQGDTRTLSPKTTAARRVGGRVMNELKRLGDIKDIPSRVLLKARNLYVTRMMTAGNVALELKISKKQVLTWADMFDWHSMRKEREFRIYSRVSKIRSRIAPNIDTRQDQIFATLEGIIEDTANRIANADQGAVDIDDIKSLVSAMKTVQDSRRLIHNKKSKVADKEASTVQGTAIFEKLVGMISGVATDPMQNPTPMLKEATYTVQDDLEAAINPNKLLENVASEEPSDDSGSFEDSL